MARVLATSGAITPAQVPELVRRLLADAVHQGASDVHFVPTVDNMLVDCRIDGVLERAAELPRAVAPNVVARLKVLAELLTYQTDRPQEGRLRDAETPTMASPEMRLSTFPTIWGEKGVVRILRESRSAWRLDDLGLPPDIESDIRGCLSETSGCLLFTGPAGSGKTTTAYACLRELSQSTTPRSLVSIEDPVEAVLPGVAQSQVAPALGFDLASGLRSLLRQDPDVILVGEIRDAPTAAAAFQAVLTGHLVLSTFHAASSAAAISRLCDMGIEPYLLRTGIRAVVGQRLVRRLCDCATIGADLAGRLGLPVDRWREAAGCSNCRDSGYQGRALIAEILRPDSAEISRALLSKEDAPHIERLAVQAGMITRWRRATAAVEAGWTSPAEIRRVLGSPPHEW